jgi:hypothetical protein
VPTPHTLRFSIHFIRSTDIAFEFFVDPNEATGQSQFSTPQANV